MPKTNVRCLFDDGINVRKCSNLVDYRTASILPWERNNGYLSPDGLLMAAAKFQWEDPAAGLLGGSNRRAVAIKADLPGSNLPASFCQKLDSLKAEIEVFANEIDAEQLAIIKSRTPAEYSDRLVCCLGQFPEHLEFPDASFDGIYNARLFHFFDGDRIRTGLTKFHRWLKPGGRVFLVNDTVYRTMFTPLIPVYEEQIAAGDEWPGFIKDVGSCIPEYLHPETFPKTMNFMDPTVLTRELNRAGFKVVTAGFYPYTGNFAPGRLDGREIAAAIGLKE